ncbi:hypothetical protein D5S17_06290 [Pseudonocardiaceae bacterium YIM PH 21723]|nr:hypothetical protein D5S17_06290 [Pseudonocardiaceae bacterium YIM PH 21723]
MWMKKALIALTAAAALAGAAPAAQAGAQDGFGRCPGGHMCLWNQMSGNGTMATFKSGAPDLGKFGVAHIGSFWNRGSRNFCIYKQTNYGELTMIVEPGMQFSSDFWAGSGRVC